ncbi:MAG: hypothetical protein ACUVV6_03710 [Thermoplasmatota archaeon]
MKTYIRVIVNSEGASPVEISAAMQELGFTAWIGQQDFCYDWGKKRDIAVEVVLGLIERVHRRLKGMNVQYEITTVP